MLTCAADKPTNVRLHSSAGPTATASNTFAITATFNDPVTGVAISDFNGGNPFPTEAGVSYSLSGAGTQWVLTVTADEPVRADKDFTFVLATASGSIAPPNQATPPFELRYVVCVVTR